MLVRACFYVGVTVFRLQTKDPSYSPIQRDGSNSDQHKASQRLVSLWLINFKLFLTFNKKTPESIDLPAFILIGCYRVLKPKLRSWK